MVLWTLAKPASCAVVVESFRLYLVVTCSMFLCCDSGCGADRSKGSIGHHDRFDCIMMELVESVSRGFRSEHGLLAGKGGRGYDSGEGAVLHQLLTRFRFQVSVSARSRWKRLVSRSHLEMYPLDVHIPQELDFPSLRPSRDLFSLRE